ncbi:MAG: zinc ribbon domain-containing protein [Chloroflexota bacterium]
MTTLILVVLSLAVIAFVAVPLLRRGHGEGSGPRVAASTDDAIEKEVLRLRKHGDDCPNCGKRVMQGVKYCPACGAKVSARVCRRCNAPYGSGDRFCRQCGAPLAQESK